LYPNEFHLARRLERTIKQGVFDVRMDTAFDRVITACGEARGAKRTATWITDDMRDAYCRLHDEGYAHSVETWKDGELVGGLYGVSLGACFYGESMFSLVPNASKVATAALVRQATHWNFPFIDCQLHNDHLESLGARQIPRTKFLEALREALKAETVRGHWKFAGWEGGFSNPPFS
ncbi:MAG: leucyl/phenylalanyl-tRNA--protein transferase, partial [Candidatus Hydrogenedentes bacterium]|nr:leucyl/phenylalanyl-tRNA--protein transferase [Candidatus Hydrogenedentota bacterium]